MRILIFMSGFFPGKKYGGPPVSINNFCNLMNDEEVYIVCTDHDLGETKRYDSINRGWNDRGNCKVLYLEDKEYGYSNLNKIAIDLKPDLIYLQSLFSRSTYYGLRIGKVNNIKILLAPRGELNSGAFRKKYKKIPYIYFLKIFKLIKDIYFQSTSIEESSSIKKQLKVSDNNIHLLHNIPSAPQNHYFYSEKVSGKGKFVFISRIHPKKNLLSAIRYFNNINGEVLFDIYGPIESKKYWKSCQDEIRKLKSNIQVNYCGIIPHSMVHDVFSKYDAFIFPTFSENFGHVIAEALSVGTIVLISDKTPWNYLKNKGVGYVIPLTQKKMYTKVIQKIVDMNDDEIRLIKERIVRYIENNNRYKELKIEYLNCFKSIIKEYQ
ncbi:glycosyltransferase [Anaerococcus tetradius]|nr:glycosyltransferase [Anaerococcus tetradius]